MSCIGFYLRLMLKICVLSSSHKGCNVSNLGSYIYKIFLVIV